MLQHLSPLKMWLVTRPHRNGRPTHLVIMVIIYVCISTPQLESHIHHWHFDKTLHENGGWWPFSLLFGILFVYHPTPDFFRAIKNKPIISPWISPSKKPPILRGKKSKWNIHGELHMANIFMGYSWTYSWLVGGWFEPLWKMMEFVNWDDEKFPIHFWENMPKIHGNQSPPSSYHDIFMGYSWTFLKGSHVLRDPHFHSTWLRNPWGSTGCPDWLRRAAQGPGEFDILGLYMGCIWI